ncbi:MAG: methyltransferase domain-containing protein [Calditrichaeota bacterium]|nr:MAG: methyltransferase domain-containing protein [Calditrichota bacterium]
MNSTDSSCPPPQKQQDSVPKILDAQLPPEKISHLYDTLAPIYDIWGKLTESRAIHKALELAAIQDGETILEVAVGTGLVFSNLVEKNPHGKNIGIDLSPGMLAKAKARLQDKSLNNYTLIEASATELPVKDFSVDLLMNTYMLDLIPFTEMEKVLKEFNRVLKVGGRLVLVNMTHGRSFFSKFYELLFRISPSLMGGCRPISISSDIHNLGFKLKHVEYLEQLFFPSEIILAIKDQHVC